jgi:hypothetical protein
VILDLVLIGLAITLEPLPLTAFLLVLASERGVRKGAAFIFGWRHAAWRARPLSMSGRQICRSVEV